MTLNMRNVALVLSLFLIFMLPWEGILNLPSLGMAGSNTAAKFMGFAVAGFWLMTVLVSGRVRRPVAFHIIVALFVLWNVLSAVWSANVIRSLVHALTWAQLTVFIYLLWDLYTSRFAVLAGLQAYVLGVYVALASTLVNYSAGATNFAQHERFSPGETNPDGFGFVLSLGIPLAWYLTIAIKDSRMGTVLKAVNYAYIPASMFGLALSGTRTAVVAALPGMAYGFATLRRLRPWTRGVIFLSLFLIILIMLPHLQSLKSFQRLYTTSSELSDGDLNGRTGIWLDGLASFAEHPFAGVGSNMYRSVSDIGKVAHNSFLSVLAELGLVGFTLFGVIITIAAYRAWHRPSLESGFWITTLLVWSIGASSLTLEHRKATWLILGLLIASSALSGEKQEAQERVRRDRSAVRDPRRKWAHNMNISSQRRNI